MPKGARPRIMFSERVMCLGYQVPLIHIKVSDNRSDNKQFDVAICATRIVAMMSTDVFQARKTITAEKKAGTLINACGNAKAKTAIFLDNGAIVSSPLSVQRLMSRIERANEGPKPRKNERMEVYSVRDPDPEEEVYLEDEDYDEDE